MASIFVYEFVTSGAWRECSDSTPSGSLLAEGRAMAASLASDLVALGHDVTLLHDDRLPFHECAGNVISTTSLDDERRQFELACRNSDYVCLIAPEFDDILLNRSKATRSLGATLISPDANFIELTADKLATSNNLLDAGIPTPETSLLPVDFKTLPPPPWVVKPRNGAGSISVQRCENETVLQSSVAKQSPECERIIQPFTAGLPVSVSVLCHPTSAITLPPCQQLLGECFQYQGSLLPLPDNLASRATTLAQAAIDVLPPTTGYIGIDIVLGDAEDGSQDFIIEVNPRLTTSYLALRQVVNVAETMLGLAQFGVGTLRWFEEEHSQRAIQVEVANLSS